MKFMMTFWALYMLFFCIPFPILIYMTTSETFMEPRNSLMVSYIYLVISLIIWLYVIVFLVNNLFVKTLKAKTTISNIVSNGISRDAKIIDYKLIKYNAKSNINLIQIVLSFQNLRNILIEHEMIFHDIKPQEKRFIIGNTVKVLLNPNIPQEPYFILAGQKTKFNSVGMVLRIFFTIFMIAYVIGLYYYFYTKESFDFGWRFLTFMHPILFSGIMFLLTIFVYQIIIGKFFKNNKEERILFSGRNADAEIINVSQTGVTVNNQPQIIFQVSFKDFRGREHIAVYKKIIDLLHLASIPKEGKIEIMYDENSPQKIIIPRMPKV
ncbi:hypothetical protein QFZ37_001485 [Chryseobacterium ginsenosidimutans]|uniref:hypothetical protein n=1 Tax=Chryseobacterium ginsenosidimutans TaxID=687846 RepID=UPI00278ACB31|nr:hypothetical protein [Chryseobacterium ginsenosidimutans]MDQ0593116.1 hypothetical protein [Chryseobacterium ginsenosidimutans]